MLLGLPWYGWTRTPLVLHSEGAARAHCRQVRVGSMRTCPRGPCRAWPPPPLGRGGAGAAAGGSARATCRARGSVAHYGASKGPSCEHDGDAAPSPGPGPRGPWSPKGGLHRQVAAPRQGESRTGRTTALPPALLILIEPQRKPAARRRPFEMAFISVHFTVRAPQSVWLPLSLRCTAAAG